MEYFCGIPRKVIFDNAKVDLKSCFGSNAIAQDNYVKLSAHYGFEPIFCSVASGNEMGLVEGLVGYIRRNICVPMTKVDDLNELNVILKEKCVDYLNHKIRGKSDSVGNCLRKKKEIYFLFLYTLLILQKEQLQE